MIVSVNWFQWIVSIINFAIMLWLFNKVCIIPMHEMVRDREGRVKKRLAEIEQALAEAKEMEATYRQQFEKLAGEKEEMQAVADKEISRIRARTAQEAEKDAAHVVQKAKNEAEKMKRMALADLQGEMARQSLAEARALLAQALDKESQADLVSNFLERVGQLRAS